MHTKYVLMLTSLLVSSQCVKVNFIGAKDIISKTRKELPPIHIPCELTDIVIISAPIIGGREPVYHLYDPKGNFKKLNIRPPQYDKNVSDYETLSVKSHYDYVIIEPSYSYKVFNVNFEQSCMNSKSDDVFGCREKEMKSNEFMIGPLSEEDYGNWVLSAFFLNRNQEWEEVSQVITLEIIEIIPASPGNATVAVGDTFEFSFAYPIPDVESCQLIVPKSTFDRFYDRNQINLKTCGFVVKNVTIADTGLWKILALGRINYEARVKLNVRKI